MDLGVLNLEYLARKGYAQQLREAAEDLERKERNAWTVAFWRAFSFVLDREWNKVGFHERVLVLKSVPGLVRVSESDIDF